MRSLVPVLVLGPWLAVGAPAGAVPTVDPPLVAEGDRAAFAEEERRVRSLGARIGVVRAELSRARAAARGEAPRMQVDELERAIRAARAEHGTTTEEVLRRRFEEADGLLLRAQARLERARDRMDRTLAGLDDLVRRVEASDADGGVEPGAPIGLDDEPLPELERPAPHPEAQRRAERLVRELQRLEIERDLAAAELELARARAVARSGIALDLVPFHEAVRMARGALARVDGEPHAAVARGDE